MGFKELWNGVKQKAPGIIGRELIGAAAGVAPMIDSMLTPYTAGVPVVSTITNAGLGYIQRNARENAMERQNKKNEYYTQAHAQSLTGEQAKSYVKERLGKKGFGAKMLKGATQEKMIQLPLAQYNTSNSHAAVGYSISPSSNKPSIGSRYSNKGRKKL